MITGEIPVLTYEPTYVTKDGPPALVSKAIISPTASEIGVSNQSGNDYRNLALILKTSTCIDDILQKAYTNGFVCELIGTDIESGCTVDRRILNVKSALYQKLVQDFPAYTFCLGYKRRAREKLNILRVPQAEDSKSGQGITVIPEKIKIEVRGEKTINVNFYPFRDSYQNLVSSIKTEMKNTRENTK